MENPEITPHSRIFVADGTGLMSREQFADVLRATLAAGSVITTRDEPFDPLGGTCAAPPPVLKGMTERDYWNAAVDQRKAEKLARRGR